MDRKQQLLASRNPWNVGDIVTFITNVNNPSVLDCDNPDTVFDSNLSYLINEVDNRQTYVRLNFYGIPGWYDAACFYNNFADLEI